MLATDFKIYAGSWAELEKDAKHIREQVFIQEQEIAAQDGEIRAHDEGAVAR